MARLKRTDQVQLKATGQEKSNSEYQKIVQGPALNQLSKMRTKKGKTTINADGHAIVHKGDFILDITNYENLSEFKLSTNQLIRMLGLTFAHDETSSQEIVITLSQYMEWRGIKDIKAARKQIKEDAELLYNSSITYDESYSKNGEVLRFSDMRIIQDMNYNYGTLMVTLGNRLFERMKTYCYADYPVGLLKTKNKHSFFIGEKVLLNKHMNVGTSHEDRLKVSTLLSCTSLPKISELPKKSSPQNKIVEPFEKALDELDFMFDWEYVHKNGEPLSDEEDIAKYEAFEKLEVQFHWKENYPDQSLRVKKKDKAIKTRIANIEKARRKAAAKPKRKAKANSTEDANERMRTLYKKQEQQA